MQFNRGERYGIVGANGSRQVDASSGCSDRRRDRPVRRATCLATQDARVIGVLKQDHFQYEDDRILDVVMMGNRRAVARRWWRRSKLLENADKPSSTANATRSSKTWSCSHDGYALESRAGEILEGLGIPSERPQRAALRRSRAGSSCACCSRRCSPPSPTSLLLDEPTNHLDILSIRWLEKFLQDFTRDRRDRHLARPPVPRQRLRPTFVDVDYETVNALPRATTHDFEKGEGGRAGSTQGGRDLQARAPRSSDHKAFVERFRAKATKARQAKSKQKADRP